MEHIPTQEADDQKVLRIARELGIGIEEAAVTCDAFHLAFSDDRMRRAIFGMIDELDDEAGKKGEPLGMILSYAVELGMDGVSVSRHANEIPPGQVVSLTPTDRAMIFVKIKDNFPTQQFLGPLIVNRPELPSAFRHHPSHFRDGVVCSDSEMKEPAILLGPSSLERPGQPICLGPIRLKFNERFPFLSPVTRHPLPVTPHPLLVTGDLSLAADHLLPFTCDLSPITSGLSPPFHAENLGYSERKMFLRPMAIDVETCVSHLDI